MANNKVYKTRTQMKNDTAENWAKAVNFIPLKGEIIIYSDLNAIKVGDGITNVNSLDFCNQPIILEAESVQNKDNEYTVDKTADEILEILTIGKSIYLSLNDKGVALGLSSVLSIGGTTALIYQSTFETVYTAVQTGTNIILVEKKILSEDEVKTLITNAKLLKKKVILSYDTTTVTNTNNEVESVLEDYIYLKKISADSDPETVYAQYMYIDGQMVEIGTTKLTLDDYITDEELTAALANLPAGEGTEEIYIGTTAPTEGNYKIWINPDENSEGDGEHYLVQSDLANYALRSELSNYYLTNDGLVDYADLEGAPTVINIINDSTLNTYIPNVQAVRNYVQSVFSAITNGDEVRY